MDKEKIDMLLSINKLKLEIVELMENRLDKNISHAVYVSGRITLLMSLLRATIFATYMTHNQDDGVLDNVTNSIIESLHSFTRDLKKGEF